MYYNVWVGDLVFFKSKGNRMSNVLFFFIFIIVNIYIGYIGFF